ncbi:MAG: 1-acyl-sn-glycerol-3-phosphate acyltransferase [Paramuribaculum sp.]|nr:1-acyl-sn-glycerol-3-phosphate acyltransferase [Paramuribaculum sp.]MDE6459516.1 1-acyl-sn-glycerol-3-phosphate acyltransferase [Paramuribaculum sp.]
MSSEQDFRDIAPFEDSEFSEKMAALVKEPGFEHAVRYVMPQVDFSEFVKELLNIHDKHTFQTKVMYPFLEMLAHKTTSGITVGGLENIDSSKAYTFISNHRDIVLDASFLNLCFLRNNFSTSEIAIGNNLLIYDWITDLVKLNKSFIVKRNLRMTKALEAAKQLSAYIHYAVTEKKESVWIAQREGRAKDSNDVTQESLVKMLALDGNGTVVQNLLPVNLVPVSITYEYDPNDYLKAKEFLMKKINPEFKKSPHDDLLSMETGLLQPKGRVHFEIGECINKAIEPLADDTDKVEVVKRLCAIIDCDIHCGYKIYPINYISYDLLHNVDTFKENYTLQEQKNFEEYIEKQLDKVDMPDITAEDRAYMREMMLTMYANPLKNKTNANSIVCLKASGDIPVRD